MKATWISLPSGLRPVRSKKNGSKSPIPPLANCAASAFASLAVEHQHREALAADEIVAHEGAETEDAGPCGAIAAPSPERDQLDEGRLNWTIRFSVPHGCRLRAPT